MNIELFNKPYWARCFQTEHRIFRGYVSCPYIDKVVRLNVHPASNEQIMALPEGERKIKRLEAHGSDILSASDSVSGKKGDLLFYKGEWYECVSAVEWDHTVLSHFNYQFTLVPKDGAKTIDITPPVGDPDINVGNSGGDYDVK